MDAYNDQPMVLDNDGVPIEIGDTVWHAYGSEWLVEELNRYGVRCFDGAKRRTFSPTFLTHTRPDSWERLEEDATMSPWSYCEKYGLVVDRSDGAPVPTAETFALDLIRRTKALMEKEVG